MKKNMMIVTRAYAKKGSIDDEFTFDWEQNVTDKIVVFPCEKDDKSCKVILIHGSDFDVNKFYESTKDLINSIKIGITGETGCDDSKQAEWAFLVHAPDFNEGGKEEFRNIISTEFEGFGIKLKFNSFYSGNSKIQKSLLDLCVKNKDFSSVFNEIWEYYNNKKNIEKQIIISKISLIKHRVENLFIPVDMNLQGWIESEFNREYAKEIAKDYSNKRAFGLISYAQKMIYSNEENVDNLESVLGRLEKILENAQRMKLVEKRDRLFKAIPRPAKDYSSYETFLGIYKLLENFHDIEFLNGLISGLKSDNYFHRWIVEIDESFEGIKELLTK
jgi:hypothetical protein